MKVFPENKKYKHRLLALFLSFLVGWILYMIGVAIFPYSGVFVIFFQAIFGGVVTGLIVLISWLIGHIVRKYVFRKYSFGRHIHLAGIVLCLFFLIFGYSLGLRSIYVNSELGTTFESINSIIGIGGYFLIVFLIANWPIRRLEK